MEFTHGGENDVDVDADSIGETVGSEDSGDIGWQLGAAFRAVGLNDLSHEIMLEREENEAVRELRRIMQQNGNAESFEGDDGTCDQFELGCGDSDGNEKEVDEKKWNEDEDEDNTLAWTPSTGTETVTSSSVGNMGSAEIKREVLPSSWSDDSLLVHDVLVYRSTDGFKFVNQYKKLDRIGDGSICTVNLFENVNSKLLFAFKTYRKSDLTRAKRYYKTEDGKMAVITHLEHVQREVNILLALKPHEHICAIKQVLDGEGIHKLYLVFPYMAGGQLMVHDQNTSKFWSPRYNGVIPLSEAARYCIHIATALAHLQLHGFVHRDVKPENILLDRTAENAVLSDFSCSIQLEKDNISSGQVRGTEGSYSFFSPQVCLGGAYNGYAADVWALGVSMFVMTLGTVPFKAQGPKQLFDLISDPETVISLPNKEDLMLQPQLKASGDRIDTAMASKELISFFGRVLSYSDTERPSAKQVSQDTFLQSQL